MGDGGRTGPTSDRVVLGIALLVVAMVVVWAAIANVLGGEIGFTTAVLIAATVAGVAWRDRITFDTLSTIALFGVPVLIGGLALS